mmetsp:Transcript_30110/g.75832  ORF Transcript_30110/g.75832 Transcript_30110/m.75832 type:complete len:234 (-) Transcript_30110:3779-4480(-)
MFQIKNQIQRIISVPREQQLHSLIVLLTAFAVAISLVGQNHLNMVFRDPLVWVLRIMLPDLRQRSQGSAILQCSDHSLCDRLRSEAGPQTDLVDGLPIETSLHETAIQVLGLSGRNKTLRMQALSEETPLVRELRDHEGQVGVHTVTLGRQRQVTQARLGVGAAILRILRVSTGPEEVNCRDDDLIVGRDDLRQGGDGAHIKAVAGERIGCGVEGGARFLVVLDPLERLEEES